MKRRQFGKKALFGSIAGVILAVAIVAVGYVIIQRYERSLYPAATMTGYAPLDTGLPSNVTVDGQDYTYKKDLTTILLMGVDMNQEEELETIEGFQYFDGHARADFLTLVIINARDETIKRLMIDRGTMTEITTLGVFGNVSGTRVLQITMAHYFGDGKERSAQLTCDAVSNLLLGAKIDFYIKLGLDAIPALNDTVGGVTVTLEDDFTQFDPEWTPGTTVTLQGERTEWFVRTRMTIGDGLNAGRMRRQSMYLNALQKQILAKIRDDYNFIGTLFDALDPFILTNMMRGRMINEANWAQGYEAKPLEILPGEQILNEETNHEEFYPDPATLQKWVLDTFWDPVEGGG